MKKWVARTGKFLPRANRGALTYFSSPGTCWVPRRAKLALGCFATVPFSLKSKRLLIAHHQATTCPLTRTLVIGRIFWSISLIISLQSAKCDASTYSVYMWLDTRAVFAWLDSKGSKNHKFFGHFSWERSERSSCFWLAISTQSDLNENCKQGHVLSAL